MHGGLQHDKLMVEPDGGVRQTHFLEPGKIKQVFEMASVFRRVNDDAVFREAFELFQLFFVEADVSEKKAQDSGRNKT